jgi:hypothetical protein
MKQVGSTTGYLFGLFSDPEDKDEIIFPNVCLFSKDYTLFHPRK